ncbi:MAG TPA: hypothetical protein VEA59_05345, partial [Patescibacteria group bacterium]|nr:hypothetical protein [Patescibacteria group bacterium]
NFEAQKKGITREAVLSEYEQKLGLSGQQMFDLQHSSVLSEFTLSKLNSSWLDYTVYHVSRSAAFILTPVLPDFLKRIDPTAIENIELPRIEPIISLVWFLFASYFIYKNKKSPYTWLCAGLILYFALLVGPVVIPRYKLQTEPFLILLAAGGLYAACKTTLSFYSNSKFQSMTSFLPLQKAKRQD